MIQQMPDPSNTADREIIITRLIKAPRELVFDVWTDPQHSNHWWGPTGFTTTSLEMDFRPGGTHRYIMHGPDGTDWPNRVVYREIVRPERLAYTHGGEFVDPERDFEVIVTFADQAGSTLLTLHSILPTAAERERVIKEVRAIEGGNQTLDRLEAYLANL